MLRQGTRSALAQWLPRRQCRHSSSLWNAPSTSAQPTKLPVRDTPPTKENTKDMDELLEEMELLADTMKQKERTEQVKWPNKGKQTTRKIPNERLSTVIPVNGDRVASIEKQAFLQQEGEGSTNYDEFEDTGLEKVPILPGSFIVTRRNDIMTLGVSLGIVFEDSREKLAMFTPTGEVWKPFETDVTFVLPSFIPPSLIERCGLLLTPVDEAQLNARAEVAKRTRTMIQDLERRASAIRMRHVYDAVKSPRPHEMAEVTVAEVARMVTKNPRYQDIFAVQLHMMNDPLHFIAKEPFLATQAFDVRSQWEVELIQTVLRWTRHGDPRLQAFADKAKPIIARTAQRLKDTALEPPAVLPAATEVEWNEDDKTIITFLKQALRPVRRNQLDPFDTACTSILRMLQVSSTALGESDLLHLLVNLGVFAPWQDVSVIQRQVPEPEYDSRSPWRLKKEKIAKKSLTGYKPAPGEPLGPEDFYATDPLETVRHDFGDMPIFVIDDASAKELDDGISIEWIPDNSGACWIHAHIANPTATLPPTHTLAVDALKQGSSLYFKHHSIPLFPSSLMYNPDLGWSLGTRNGKPTRTMTFSAKINRFGDIVDHKVRAGLINNVRVISYEAVNKILDFDPVARGIVTRPFGGPLAKNPPIVEVPALPTEEVKALKDLYKVTRLRRKWWMDHHLVSVWPPAASTKVGDWPAGSMTATPIRYREFQGFPEFKDYTVTIGEGASDGMVAEVMKMAGIVGSKFALDHGLPMIRRSLDEIRLLNQDDEEVIRKLRSSSGQMNKWDLTPYVAAFPTGQYTLEPKAHSQCGARDGEGYARVTSPLRRALDLVSHWQLQSALLNKSPAKVTTFSPDWLDNFKVSFALAELTGKKLDQSHSSYWTSMFVKKWMGGELRGDGFSTWNRDALFEGIVSDVGGRRPCKLHKVHGVDVPALGLSMDMETAGDYLKIGQKVNLRLQEVLLKSKSTIGAVHVP
ncbi:hypothetical protein D9611_001446 [Ephemerocybe angulata]|uniref:RNB domain-containing protein n=1 Tax=Ephemerocybe angulata TaxID=980116 RepID=A0A8H5CHU3_9AGAR|nr:hypothetical protein D9611_001446 [Tulosesus angulatus]